MTTIWRGIGIGVERIDEPAPQRPLNAIPLPRKGNRQSQVSPAGRVGTRHCDPSLKRESGYLMILRKDKVEIENSS